MKLEFYRQIFEKYSNTKFHENPSSGSIVLSCGRTGRFEEAIVAFAVLQEHLRWMTYLLTPWSRVLLEKLTVSAASQEIPHIFGTRRFLIVPRSARHLSLSWANSIQSPQPLPTSWRSIVILSSHLRLGLPNGLLTSSEVDDVPRKLKVAYIYIYIYIYIYDAVRSGSCRSLLILSRNNSGFITGGSSSEISAHKYRYTLCVKFIATRMKPSKLYIDFPHCN